MNFYVQLFGSSNEAYKYYKQFDEHLNLLIKAFKGQNTTSQYYKNEKDIEGIQSGIINNGVLI